MYTDATPPITSTEEVLDGLAGVRDHQRLIDRGLVVLAVEWAKHNPTSPLPVNHPGYEGEEEQWVFDQLHHQGCLTFDDSRVAEFAIASGLTEYSARKLIRESLMLVHLLPRVWARVLSGGVDVWRARLLAGDCFDLSTEAIDFIDRQMANVSARITVNTREGITREARKRFMPEDEQHREEEARNSRGVEIFNYNPDGSMVNIYAYLDLPDAVALDAALTTGAQALKDAGSDAPVATRRAWALGDLARAASGQGALDLQAPNRPTWDGSGVNPPNVNLYIHFPSPELAVVEGTGQAGKTVCDPSSVYEWFTRPRVAGPYTPKISVRPILNLEHELNTDAYQVPPRTVEQIRLTHTACVFPFCESIAHRCDIDHIEPWKPNGAGGATCSCNLAPLCRRHHRLKTHSDNAPVTSGKHNRWSYVHLGGQEYFWTGPRGMEFIRNRYGTFSARADHNIGAPTQMGVLGHQETTRVIDLGDARSRELTENLIGELLNKPESTDGLGLVVGV